MKRTPSDFARDWEAVEGRKTDFENEWKLVEDDDDVFLGWRPKLHRVVPFDASLSVEGGDLYVSIHGTQVRVPIDAVKALLRASKEI